MNVSVLEAVAREIGLITPLRKRTLQGALLADAG
jgi:hypothetical protein